MLVVRGGVWFVIPSVAEESASDKSVSDSKWGPMSSYESEWGPMRLLQTTKTSKLIETHQKTRGYKNVTCESEAGAVVWGSETRTIPKSERRLGERNKRTKR